MGDRYAATRPLERVELPKVDPEIHTTRGQIRSNVAHAAKILRIAVAMVDFDPTAVTEAERDEVRRIARLATEVEDKLPKRGPSA